MAKSHHLRILKTGVDEWNRWRAEHPEEKPDLSNVNLEGVELLNADFRQTDLSGANLKWAKLSMEYQPPGDYKSAACLERACLQKANLYRASLGEVDCSGANLESANLECAYAMYASFADANLKGALLDNVNLREANLRNADFTNASLCGADLDRASLVGCCFRNADLKGALIGNAFAADDKDNAADFTCAVLRKAHIPTLSSQYSGPNFFLRFLHSKGLETADFGDETTLLDYLSQAFSYAHRNTPDSANSVEFMTKTIARIKALRKLYSNLAESTQLVHIIQHISSELLAHLKKHPDKLDHIKPRQFEELIAEILASHGWQVELTPETRDGGYDIYAISKEISGCSNHWLIECKKYRKDRRVGVDIVRGLYGVKLLTNSNANIMLATTSDFTRDVQKLKASRYDLDLRNYEAVLDWINTYKPLRSYLL